MRNSTDICRHLHFSPTPYYCMLVPIDIIHTWYTNPASALQPPIDKVPNRHSNMGNVVWDFYGPVAEGGSGRSLPGV